MKRINMKFILAALLVSVIFSGCGNAPTEEKKESSEPTASTGSTDLMKEGPAYNKTKIDPKAPVMTITLKTMGNTMADMKYDQSDLKVKEGSTIKLILINTAKDAAMIHNFVLIEAGSADKVGPAGVTSGPDKNFVPDLKEVLVATPTVGPGKETSITFPAPTKGVYDFICTYPGHYKMMNGKLTVE